MNPTRTLTDGELSLILGQVNGVRRALAIGEGTLAALPPGRLSDPEECVLARALSNGWRGIIEDGGFLLPPPDVQVDLPAAVAALDALGFDARVESAESLGEPVDGDFDAETGEYRDGIHFVLPSLWARFVFEFDRGALPFLILER